MKKSSCPDCDGAGERWYKIDGYDEGIMKCDTCNGNGYILIYSQPYSGSTRHIEFIDDNAKLGAETNGFNDFIDGVEKELRQYGVYKLIMENR